MNALLIFNLWMKDVDMCIHERNLSNMLVARLMKDYIMDHAHSVLNSTLTPILYGTIITSLSI